MTAEDQYKVGWSEQTERELSNVGDGGGGDKEKGRDKWTKGR
jgi:hypothetical protein